MSDAVRLKKRLGQHHLLHGHLCAPLIRFLAPSGRRVVEVGPGGGILTRELMAAGASRVVGVELDREWAFRLRREVPSPTLSVLVADGLEFPWEALPAGSLVTGNLPYNVASPILQGVLRAWKVVPRAAVMVQLEVAQRLTAAPGAAEYGALSILVAARSRTLLLGRVRKGAFRPPPKVDGGLVGLELHAPPLPEEEMGEFGRWVLSLFAQRRKTLRRSLSSLWSRPAAESALEMRGVDPRVRVERLGVEDLVELFRCRPGRRGPRS